MTLLTAGVAPGAGSAANNTFNLIRTLSESLKKVPSPKKIGSIERREFKPVSLPNMPLSLTNPPPPSKPTATRGKRPAAKTSTFSSFSSRRTIDQISNSAIPSSDAVPPSSPTLAVRQLAESYRQRGEARNAASSSRPIPLLRFGTSLPSTSKANETPRSISVPTPIASSGTVRGNIASNLALPGNSHGKERSDSVSSASSKAQSQASTDENTNPLPPRSSSEKKRPRADSGADMAPSAKKGRMALADSDNIPIDPILLLPRPLTPPPTLGKDSSFTSNPGSSPKTPRRNKSLSHIEASLFTPSPMKTPSRSISNGMASILRSGKSLFAATSPSFALGSSEPGFFSPFVPNTRTNLLAAPMTPSGSSLTRGLFEDQGINLGWMDFAESDQERLQLHPSSDPADIADASASIAAANSDRWLGLPPSSPPPPSSPVQSMSSDLDFMSVDSHASDVPSSHVSVEASTPTSELEAEIADATAGLDSVDPFEFFASLGFTFPQGDIDGLMVPNYQEQSDSENMAQGMKELISGCVL